MSTQTLSATRIAELRRAMSAYVDRGELPGLVMLVSRGGDTHVEALGERIADSGKPIARDAIFRISSMNRPITAAAAMILVEENVFRLDDRIEQWLPELSNRRVLVDPDAPLDQTVPAKRPISVRDLLTLRSGYGMSLRPPTSPFEKRAAELGLVGFGPPMPSSKHTPDEWMTLLGELPLLHQPGERWMYNTGSSILGVLVARASGKPLEEFYREHIFEPLGMRDTGFSVPTEKLDRFTGSYLANQAAGGSSGASMPASASSAGGASALSVYDPGDASSDWAKPPIFPDGGAGLVSTVDDYFAFTQMLINFGEHPTSGTRVLSHRAVELMTMDHIAPEQKAVSPFFPNFWDDRGWGFGMAVVTKHDALGFNEGAFGWDGGLGTTWYSDPNSGLTGILMTQLLMNAPAAHAAYADFWTHAHRTAEA